MQNTLVLDEIIKRVVRESLVFNELPREFFLVAREDEAVERRVVPTNGA